MKSIASAILSLALLLPAGAAAADGSRRVIVRADGQIAQQERVSYHDLDLDTPAGAKTMLVRLHRASIHACGGDPALAFGRERLVAALMPEFRKCRSTAMSDAVGRLNAPVVAAMHSRGRAETQLAKRSDQRRGQTRSASSQLQKR